MPLNKGLEFTQAKDQRIAWLSIFSSLCRLKREITDPEEIIKEADSIVKELYRKYPFPEEDDMSRPVSKSAPRPLKLKQKDVPF